ncbi:hypothetical protein [Streptomyces alanosinicus]|uniref:Uncharacterized protein n=1 Tax=Streptomyces alanosinicus TaxID=68171 RepID=A0A918YHN7_9ACTN|nr:hypothetical protein [Streptomyces alanosinicus]GHE03364.1 hypothetical protein GCM10010339_30490 [Streptomyces alanosinicus]
MLPSSAYGDSRLSLWLRVRTYAVPPSMIEVATGRRTAGDWAGACAAARIDVDLDPASVARAHGREIATLLRADLRSLAPDLLRWHMPRIAPDGLLRPGLTLALARYERCGRAGPLHLVARTPPAWADAGQRISLALWDPARPESGRHPHPRPNRRFRLDLHRHLWDAGRAGELRARSGADGPAPPEHDPLGLAPPDLGCAVGRWAAEAGVLLRTDGPEGRLGAPFAVRIGGRRRLVLAVDAGGSGAPGLRVVTERPPGGRSAVPVLPDAATWVTPDLELLRAGLLTAERLHPLVAAALVPGHRASGAVRDQDPVAGARRVECRGATHRIGLVDGVLVPLDHEPDEIRREELLAALGGPPLPCLRIIDEAHRDPHCLSSVRERLDHGDTDGALAVVEGLLGPAAVLRAGPLRDELAAAAERRIAYGLYRAGLTGSGRTSTAPSRRTDPGRRLTRRQARTVTFF